MAVERAIEGVLEAAIVGLAIVAFPEWVAYQEARHLIMHAKGVEHHYCRDDGKYAECGIEECYCSCI